MTDWPCSGCGEAQVTLGPEAPPTQRLCHDCLAKLDRPPLASLLAKAGVPWKFRQHATREAWMAFFGRPTFQVGGWPAAGEQWLCLWGPTGTGKTSAATVLLAEHLARGGRGLWIDGMTLMGELSREMDSGSEQVVLPRLCHTPFLVLDEPFSGYLTDYAAGRMLMLIRHRDQHGAQTIVTSQLDPEALVALGANARKYPTGSLGAAVSRALSGRVIEVDGLDERLAKARTGQA